MIKRRMMKKDNFILPVIVFHDIVNKMNILFPSLNEKVPEGQMCLSLICTSGYLYGFSVTKNVGE